MGRSRRAEEKPASNPMNPESLRSFRPPVWVLVFLTALTIRMPAAESGTGVRPIRVSVSNLLDKQEVVALHHSTTGRINAVTYQYSPRRFIVSTGVEF